MISHLVLGTSRRLGRALFLVLILPVGSCHNPLVMDDCCEEALAGPLFTIAAVNDAGSGAPLTDVRVGDFTPNGYPYLTPQLVWRDSNVEWDPLGLLCHVPCKFGADEGDWTMRFRRIGYLDTTLAVHAVYKSHRISGSTKYLSGGITVRVSMTRSANEALHTP